MGNAPPKTTETSAETKVVKPPPKEEKLP